MIAKVTRSIYQILENIAEKEIEKDPIAFIKEQSFLRPTHQGNDEQVLAFDQDDYEELKVENLEMAGG